MKINLYIDQFNQTKNCVGEQERALNNVLKKFGKAAALILASNGVLIVEGISPVHASLPCYHQSEHTYKGTLIRIHRTDKCGQPFVGGRPLLIFAHGDGYLYNGYPEFMLDLVAQSAVVVSVSQGADLSNAERAGRMLSAIDYLRIHWPHKQLLDGRIAFIGHSRGGEAVLTAAREHFNQTGNRAEAVVSIMATDNADGGGEHEYLTGLVSGSYLSLAATRDGDVKGYCVPSVFGCSAAYRNGLTLYDRVGFENADWNADYLIDKSAKLLEGFSHGGWATPLMGNQGIQVNKELPIKVQRAVIHEYVTRFLDWQVYENNQQRYYFQGVMEPELTVGVVSQYSGHSDPVYTIDSFEDGELTVADKGPGLVTITGPAEFWEGTAKGHDPTAAHDSGSLGIKWRYKTSSIIRWGFPNEHDQYIPTFDASGYPYISLRAARVFGHSSNGEALTGRIRIADVKGKISDVLIGDSTPFEIPLATMEKSITTSHHQNTNTITGAMATIRIPLLLFKDIDLAGIRSVSIVVGEDSTRGALILDSLEFTH